MRLKDLIFPPRCGACEELLPVAPKLAVPMLCPVCEKELRAEMMTQCKTCFLPMADCRCVPKVMASRGFTAHLKLVPFSDTRYATARALVLTLKESADPRYYDGLAELLLPAVRAAIRASDKSRQTAGNTPISRTAIAFLPRTPFQKCKHGTDQAECLARALATRLDAELLSLFRRRQRACVQKSLSRAARLANARGSLLLCRSARTLDLTDCRVILVDDVVTTGASMAAAAELLQAGELMAVSVAFTPKAEKQ